jgi:four helix bundle protein
MTDKSFAVFLAQARGSLFELQTQIELARDLGFAAQGPTQS